MTDLNVENRQEKIKMAIEKDRRYGLNRLRDEFGLRPARGQKPVDKYKGANLYAIKDCVAISTQPPRPRTPAQIAASARLAQAARLRSRAARAGKKAFDLMLSEPVFLDTETTGLDELDQIIEIAIVDSDGDLLYESRVCPTVPINPGAQAVNGISIDMLSDAPSWPEIYDHVNRVLAGKTVVMFNAEFDWRMLMQTSAAHNLNCDPHENLNTFCAKELSSFFYGYRISLRNSIRSSDLDFKGDAHTARADAIATRDLVSFFSKHYCDLSNAP